MASTFSTNLALELIGTGDQAGTWGNTTNTNLGTLIEQAISGYVTQAVTTGNTTTITIPNGSTGVARNMYIELTGTGGTNTVLEVPSNKKLYFIFNNASGAVTVKVSGQTGISVPAGEKKILVSNGTDIVEATSYLVSIPTSLTLTTLTATNVGATNGSFASANITSLTGTTATFPVANITIASGTTLNYTSATLTTVSGTAATFTTSSDNAGNLRNIPSAGTTKTSAYTLSISDIGEFVTVGTGGSVVVPNDIFSAGNAVSIFNNTSTNVSIDCPITTAYFAGVDVDRASLTLATRGVAVVLFINPSLCIISGSVS